MKNVPFFNYPFLFKSREEDFVRIFKEVGYTEKRLSDIYWLFLFLLGISLILDLWICFIIFGLSVVENSYIWIYGWKLYVLWWGGRK